MSDAKVTVHNMLPMSLRDEPHEWKCDCPPADCENGIHKMGCELRHHCLDEPRDPILAAHHAVNDALYGSSHLTLALAAVLAEVARQDGGEWRDDVDPNVRRIAVLIRDALRLSKEGA